MVDTFDERKAQSAFVDKYRFSDVSLGFVYRSRLVVALRTNSGWFFGQAISNWSCL